MKHTDPLERAIRVREPGPTWDDEKFRSAREQDLRQRTANVSSAVVATLSCLLLATLLTSGKLVEIAERQELGPTRDRQLAVAEGVDRVANFLSLNRPYDLIHDIRGVGDDASARIDTIDEVVADLDLEPDVDDGPGPADPAIPDVVAPGETTTTTTTTTTVPAAFRVVSAADPLAVFVGGDSQAEYLGQAITTESGLPLAVGSQHEISSSLSRPDYFNWPARIRELAEGEDPEAVVFFLGANDYQDLAGADGARLIAGSEGWQVEWRRRLAITFDLLRQDDRQVFWVTQPPMRDGGLDEGVRVINQLAAEVIADRDFVTSIDIWQLFGGESGFRERMVAPDGSEIRARIGDGVHLTREAASLVADLVFAEMAGVWEFAPG